MQKDFSIIIPTLNSEKYLEETIRSIKNQSKSILIECIFTDGGSIDRTFEIIDNFNQDNITKIVISKNLGMTEALNDGFNQANGKYLTYLNSDDKLDDFALQNLKISFESNENINWIIGNCENIGSKNYLNKIINLYKAKLLKKLDLRLLLVNNIISQPSVFWKKDFFYKVGKFDETLRFNMDYDMWIRMIKLSNPLIINHRISFFRRHSASLSYKNSFDQFKEKFNTMKKYNSNFFITLLHIMFSFIILIIYKITKY